METQREPILETLEGVVERITFHNEDNGWTVMKVSPIDSDYDESSFVTVVVSQLKVFVGASATFKGRWNEHPKFGSQFVADSMMERQPASLRAIEKYIGSGLIKGVGPKTATKIVKHFKNETLDVFENQIERLRDIRGISASKLDSIRDSWSAHKNIRDLVLFLQEFDINPSFAVKIYKVYKDEAIEKVKENPYQLARDIHGVGFLTTDKLALEMGVDPKGPQRLQAAIEFVVRESTRSGHCYIYRGDIEKGVSNLIGESDLGEFLSKELEFVCQQGWIEAVDDLDEGEIRYILPRIFQAEVDIVEWLQQRPLEKSGETNEPLGLWVDEYCRDQDIQLSSEQVSAVVSLYSCVQGILTGGPGCGKTLTTKILSGSSSKREKSLSLWQLPQGGRLNVCLKVIGLEARTLHRLLEFDPGVSGFRRDRDYPLDVDVVIVDEASMIDIYLMQSLFRCHWTQNATDSYWRS